MLVICDLLAGNIYLKYLIDQSKVQKFEEFQTFLMTLEVYGCGYNKDIDKYKYSHRAEKTHAQEAKEELEIIVNVL